MPLGGIVVIYSSSGLVSFLMNYRASASHIIVTKQAVPLHTRASDWLLVPFLLSPPAGATKFATCCEISSSDSSLELAFYFLANKTAQTFHNSMTKKIHPKFSTPHSLFKRINLALSPWLFGLRRVRCCRKTRHPRTISSQLNGYH